MVNTSISAIPKQGSVPYPSLDTLPQMPSWVAVSPRHTLEEVALMSGAALSVLHLIMARDEVPHALLRERCALRAAEACVVLSGRSERAADLRDEVHLLRHGDQPGPAGAVYLMWHRTVARKVSVKALQRAMSSYDVEQITAWLDMGRGTPIDQAALVLEAVLVDAPRAEETALILADAALARALGWGHIVPLLAGGLKARDLRKTGDDLRLAVHKAVVVSGRQVVPMAADLARRVAHLHAVVPKLRSKASDKAIEMFLTRDALAPSVALTGLMTDRSARRLCDRLVVLGGVRELTGRDSFRLYGV